MNHAAIKRVYQIGIVVPDAEKSMRAFCQLFGLDFSKAQIGSTKEIFTEGKYNGKSCEFSVILALINYAGVEFEFIQPELGDTNPYADYLRDHGPGIHHIHVQFKDYDKSAKALLDAGGTVLTSGKLTDWGLYEYFDMRDTLGFIIEASPGITDEFITNVITDNLIA